MARPPSNPDDPGGMLPATAESPASFEASLAELEAIVQKMEGGTLTLEQSLAAYKRGAELVVHARRSLADVEQQVRILEADVLEPFESGDAES